jgi:hypothetical protein
LSSNEHPLLSAESYQLLLIALFLPFPVFEPIRHFDKPPPLCVFLSAAHHLVAGS